MTTLPQTTSPWRRITRTLGRIGPAYYALVVLLIIATVSQESFMTGPNVSNIIRNSAVLAIVTIGQIATMLIAGIDLSIGSVISLTTVIAGLQMEANPDSAPLVVLLCLGVGLVIGAINGFGVGYLKLNPLIFTLATGTAIQGLNLHLLYSPGGLVTRDFRNLSRGAIGPFECVACPGGEFGPIPYAAIYLLVLFVIGTWVLKKTSFGLSIYAVGGNEASARLSGIRTARVKLLVYMISSFFAVLGGLFLASRIGSGDPLVGDPYTLDSITAGVLGGASLFGGVGDLWGGLAAVFTLGVLSTMLNFNNVSPFYQFIIKGLILIGALAVGYLRTRGKNV
jgi:ribose transport system permease protein